MVGARGRIVASIRRHKGGHAGEQASGESRPFRPGQWRIILIVGSHSMRMVKIAGMVIAVAVLSSCGTVDRSEIYDRYDARIVQAYEKRLSDMSPEEIKVEAEQLRKDIVANEREVETSFAALTTATGARRAAVPSTEVELGAKYIETRERHTRAIHRQRRMKETLRVLKRQYARRVSE